MLIVHHCFQDLDIKDLATSVLIAITIDANVLFLEEFFDKIWSLNFPKNQIDLFVSCQSEKNFETVGKIVKNWKSADTYRSVTFEKEFKGKFLNSFLRTPQIRKWQKI